MSEHEDNFMEFSNEEIVEFLVKPLRKYPQLDIRLLAEDDLELEETSAEQIRFVVLDGDKCDFYLYFYSGCVSLFTPAESREFMFIDDNKKDMFTSSDTYGNVPYEGTLRGKTHREIFELILQFIQIFIGTTKIVIKGKEVSRRESGYPIGEFTVWLTKNSDEKCEITIDNIKFIIN